MSSGARIGIVGGAGPMAGQLLFQRIIETCQVRFGCVRDADFPFIMLINYPFHDMLKSDYSRKIIQDQLSRCFEVFEANDIDISAIACNTLHAFLEETPSSLINMIDVTADAIAPGTQPLILCTTTSASSQLHRQRFPCIYPNDRDQHVVDAIIDEIITGSFDGNTAQELLRVVANIPDKGTAAVLGCTELSLLHDRFPLKSDFATIIDPVTIIADRICNQIFM